MISTAAARRDQEHYAGDESGRHGRIVDGKR
jgi:hypothetical protein